MLQTSKPKYSGVSASLTWTTLVPSGDQGRGVATIGHKWGNFGLCCCGWQTVGSAPDEKSFYGVTKGSNKQHEKIAHYYVVVSRLERSFFCCAIEVRGTNRRTGFRTRLHKQSCLLYTSPSPRDRTRYRMPS